MRKMSIPATPSNLISAFGSDALNLSRSAHSEADAIRSVMVLHRMDRKGSQTKACILSFLQSHQETRGDR